MNSTVHRYPKHLKTCQSLGGFSQSLARKPERTLPHSTAQDVISSRSLAKFWPVLESQKLSCSLMHPMHMYMYLMAAASHFAPQDQSQRRTSVNAGLLVYTGSRMNYILLQSTKILLTRQAHKCNHLAKHKSCLCLADLHIDPLHHYLAAKRCPEEDTSLQMNYSKALSTFSDKQLQIKAGNEAQASAERHHRQTLLQTSRAVVPSHWDTATVHPDAPGSPINPSKWVFLAQMDDQNATSALLDQRQTFATVTSQTAK